VPDDDLPAANALAGIYRPIMIRMVGPAIAGLVVAAVGPGPAFGVDALSFALSAIAIWNIRVRRVRHVADHGLRATIAEVKEGFRYTLSQPWIWATLIAAMFSLLVFVGPVEVLVP